MTLQQLLDIHKPSSLSEADALVKGNYFHYDVIRDEYRFGDMRLGYRYEVIKRRVMGMAVSREVGYVFVN